MKNELFKKANEKNVMAQLKYPSLKMIRAAAATSAHADHLGATTFYHWYLGFMLRQMQSAATRRCRLASRRKTLE